MSSDNHTRNLQNFSDSQYKLFCSVQAFDDFISNIDIEHHSYTLLDQLNQCLQSAHRELESYFTTDLDDMYRVYLKTAEMADFGRSGASNVVLLRGSSTLESWGSLSE